MNHWEGSQEMAQEDGTMPRVGIVGFMHESNTFSSNRTTRREFENAHLDHGEGLISSWKDAHHELGGFLEGCRRHHLEPVPLFAAWATPSGPLSRETYEELLGEIRVELDSAGRLDGVLLALHGAMVVEGIDSADGETVRRIREWVGEETPIGLTLDLHGNLSPAMVEIPEVTLVYRTYPHLDQRERGLEAAGLISRILNSGCLPRQAYRKLPILIHLVRQYTGSGPMREVYDRVRRIAESPGILTASFAPGYPFADVPDLGATAIVVSDDDPDLAEEKVQELADWVLSRKEELNADLPDVEQAVREARQAGEGPVVLMDCGDNIGGGGPGDSTFIFREILKQKSGTCCVILYDPESVAVCERNGIGATVRLEVGGKTDNRHGAPVPISGRVKHLSDGTFEEPEPRHGGERYLNQGPTAVVETEEGHTVILNSLRVMPASLRQITSLGVDPEKHAILIVKGVNAPRAAYEPIASEVIAVDSPGVTRVNLDSFVYRRRPSPLYPLDPIDEPRGGMPR